VIQVLLLATAMGLLLQILAARLGVVTGKNLAEVRFPVDTMRCHGNVRRVFLQRPHPPCGT